MESEDSSEESIAGNATAPYFGAYTQGWSGVCLSPKGSLSSHKKLIEEVNVSGVYGVRKYPNVKVNRQMDNVILLDILSQVTILKQKDHVEFFILKGIH